MDTNTPVAQPLAQPQAPVNPASVTQPVQPQNFSVSQSEHHTGRSFLKVLLLLVIIVGATAGIVFVGYRFMGASNTPTTVAQNANVYKEPARVTASPTPSVYQSNPADTTDTAIDQDTQISNNSISGLDASLNEVDQSLKDQQTNLQ